MVALFVLLTIVAFLLADAIVLRVRRRAAAASAGAVPPDLRELLPQPALPGGVFLSPSHLWVGLMPEGEARVGFDPLVRAALGRPDAIDAPAPGLRVRKGEPLFSARFGRRSVLFPAPLDGTVRSAEEGADADGWVLTLEPAHAHRDLKALPLAEEARNWFSREWERLREFVGARSVQAAPAFAMPDGGAPLEGWLRLEADEAWDGFVNGFLRAEDAVE